MIDGQTSSRPSASIAEKISVTKYKWISNLERLEATDEGGDTVFLFDRLSGDTHILNFFSYAILQMLNGQPYSVKDIEFRFSHDTVYEDYEITGALVKNTIRSLDDAGLIHPR